MYKQPDTVVYCLFVTYLNKVYFGVSLCFHNKAK